jgi:hypothetical protein
MNSQPTTRVNSCSHSAEEAAWQPIRDALRGLQFGYVNIIVQDGVIVQIDRTEKRRLQRRQASTPVDSEAVEGVRE